MIYIEENFRLNIRDKRTQQRTVPCNIWGLSIPMHSFFLGHLGTDATAAASVTAVAIPLAFIACFVLHLPVMVVYVVMCLDEIVKVPFIRWRYNKYIWLKNLTEEKT